MVDFYKTFASHINVPKGKWDIYHEPFKDEFMECDIVINNFYARLSGGPSGCLF